MGLLRCVQAFSATETQLMQRNGDIQHVRRSTRKATPAPGHASLSQRHAAPAQQGHRTDSSASGDSDEVRA